MIQEDYVSFEVAKLLEEKWFNEYCPNSYFKMDRTLKKSGFSEWEKVNEIRAPTQALAMKWLRELHNLFIEIQCYGCEANKKAHFEYSYVISEYVKINTGICTIFGLEKRNAKSRFPSYETACEAAIKYCLENFVK